jgi:ATPase subunit of ABC transporter with duplicated ATPase domains
MVMGAEQPDSGTITIGETVQIAYVDQSHKDLLPDKTVYEVLTGGLENITFGNVVMNSRAYLSRFNFSGTDQNKKVGILSGGERNRLHLAMTVKQSSNVLLLDEPTNDLDVNTLRALEEAIQDYSGCAVIISHDRWFMDRVCTHILAFEGDSKVYWFEGGFSDYEENYKKRVGDIVPKRLKYKKLVRG